MKIAIISGASSGIGKAVAKELDHVGLDELWIVGRREEKLNILKEELSCPTRCFPLDLTDEKSFDVMTDALEGGDYKIEYLVASAGVGYTGAFEKNTHSQISNMIDLNCKSLSLLISVALPFMNENGRIINIASGAGFLPQADFAVYAATKAYVISFSRALGKELSPRRIKVCAVCPGPVDTEFFAGLENVKEYKRKYLISPSSVAIGAIKAADKGKAIYTPTLSMKMLHFATKFLPTSLLLKLTK